jgi:hypothetical protein
MLLRFEVFTAVTMKNVVFWDIKPSSYFTGTHYFSTTESSRLMLLRFAVFTAVTMKNAFFWDIKPRIVLHRRHITSPVQSPAG